MSEQSISWGTLSSLVGIRIIPSEDVTPGFKHTEGTDIFVSFRNYEQMKPLSAKGTIILLGFLTEQAPIERAEGQKMLHEIIKRTLRVPVRGDLPGDGQVITRQLDATLMNVGFKLSRDLFDHLSHQHPAVAAGLGKEVLAAVKELIGEHVQHNVYFIGFPQNVPDTADFWWTEFIRLFMTGQTRYGQYQHTYEDMLEFHDEFVSSAKDRVTILHLGKSLPEETLNLYHLLAQSPIPLNDVDLGLVKELALTCLSDPQPENIPMRETKALINLVRINNNRAILVDTPTDILRLACALSDGDVTLQEKTKFRSFSRPVRRSLLSTLDDMIAHSPAQLADIHRYLERWKRLGERLHPHEYPQGKHTQDVFAVARGEKKVFSFEAKVEVALRDGDLPAAISLLRTRPGVLARNVDRLLLAASREDQKKMQAAIQEAHMTSEEVQINLDRILLQEALRAVIGNVSGRVLLSLREHLQNREVSGQMRVFANRKGRAWVTSDAREPLDAASIKPFVKMLDEELLRRMPRIENLVVDPEVLGVAIPLSDRNKGNGFAIMPRGSTMAVEQGILRFFVYWKQKEQRTDYDLSALILNDRFELKTQLSYTNLQSVGGVHSGDLTSAPNGATEFIDVDLRRMPPGAFCILPQVNIFAGEDFDAVESCFFGFMSRTEEQRGKPFEAATVRVKSDLRGAGRIALPMVFMRGRDGQWSAKWLHLYLKGRLNFNRVEGNHLTAGVLARSIVDHRFLTLDYLIGLMRENASTFSWATEQRDPALPVTFIGLEAPDGPQQEDATIYTLLNLPGLIPA